jgi:hypothetical protein
LVKSYRTNSIKYPYYPLQTYQNPSVCLADIIPAGPQKKGALMCRKSTNLGPAQQSYAGLLPLKKGDYQIVVSAARPKPAVYPTDNLYRLAPLWPLLTLGFPAVCTYICLFLPPLRNFDGILKYSPDFRDTIKNKG